MFARQLLVGAIATTAGVCAEPVLMTFISQIPWQSAPRKLLFPEASDKACHQTGPSTSLPDAECEGKIVYHPPYEPSYCDPSPVPRSVFLDVKDMIDPGRSTDAEDRADVYSTTEKDPVPTSKRLKEGLEHDGAPQLGDPTQCYVWQLPDEGNKSYLPVEAGSVQPNSAPAAQCEPFVYYPPYEPDMNPPREPELQDKYVPVPAQSTETEDNAHLDSSSEADEAPPTKRPRAGSEYNGAPQVVAPTSFFAWQLPDEGDFYTPSEIIGNLPGLSSKPGSLAVSGAN